METFKKRIQCKFIVLKRPNLVSLNQNIRPMVKKRMIMIFIALMAGSSLNAQNQTSTIPKWEVGIDLLWLINKNKLPEYSMLIKLYHKPLQAWRIRFGADFRTAPGTNVRNVDKANFMLRLGHEWGKNVTKNMVVYGGGEAHYQKDEILYWLLPTPPVFPYYSPAFSWQLGGVGFIGCRYSVSSVFSVALESSFKVYHREYVPNNYATGLILVTPDNYEFEGGKLKFIYQTGLKSTVFEVQPIQSLSISYCF